MHTPPDKLWTLLEAGMLSDRRRLSRKLEALQRGGAGDRSGRHGRDRPGLTRQGIADEIAASVARRKRRLENLPKPVYPPELPVVQRREEIAAAIRDNQVIVLCGETGSGKTTQLPKICLELGRGVAGMIGHTQPRRIAARSVAGRIASELSATIGHAVGYKMRFSDKTSQDTYIKVMTDGILLAETQADPLFEQYDTLIIDEAHERSLNIDFLLGYIKRLLPRRPDLKLIITSATIDPQRFARHFGTGGANGKDAPIIEVSGRTYPVEVKYRPPLMEEDGEFDLVEAILEAVDELCGVPPRRLSIEEDRGKPVDGEDEHLHAQDEPLGANPVDGAGGVSSAPQPSTGFARPPTGLAHPGRAPKRTALPGDVLIFLSGEREIRETAEALRKHHPPGTEILPLYARLSAAEQQRVFEPHSARRIVLATNVAETSLTVPRIKYVIDPGMARLSRYSARTKVQRLPIEPISQASADQRKGRCGRVSEGVCIRLFSEEDYLARPQYTEPEILRTNLASVILQMKALQLGEVVDFPFVEPPESRLIRDGYDTLHELGAVDDRGVLTRIGSELAKLPIDPRLGRMILAAQDEGCQEEVLVIAAALSIQDPRERPMDKQDAADIAHKRFAQMQKEGEESDFLTYLHIWKFYQEASEHLSHNKLRKACQQNFLSPTRMREWDEVYRQLHTIVAERSHAPPPLPAGEVSRGLASDGGGGARPGARETPRPPQNAPAHKHANGRPTPPPVSRTRPPPPVGPGEEQRRRPTYDSIHTALLAGLLGNIGVKTDAHEYTGARNTKFHIFPGSALFKKGPKWVMAAEIVQTTKLYARTVARIQPQWIERLAPHLIKKSFSEPHWDAQHARVNAFEKVTLYGLEIVAKRSVHYGPIDPVVSRDMFIKHALVEGEYITRAPFFEHNRRLIHEVHEHEAKSRRRNLLADVEKRAAFFDARIPPTVFSGDTFDHWRKQAERQNQKILFMTLADLLAADAPDLASRDSFPDTVVLGGRLADRSDALRVPVEYVLEPGNPDDGITAKIPIGALNRVEPRRAEWLVPGMLHDKVVGLIKSLPKNIRTCFVPAPVFADRALELLIPMVFPSATRVKPETQEKKEKPENRASSVGDLAAEMKARAQSALVAPPPSKQATSGTHSADFRREHEEAFAIPSLIESLSGALRNLTGIDVPLAAWQPAELPEHLRMNFVVVDERGNRIAAGRDFEAVKRKVRGQLKDALGRLPHKFNRDGVTDWDFGDLPVQIEVRHNALVMSGFPAVVVPESTRDNTVRLRLLDSRDASRAAMHAGVRKLFLIHVHKELAFILKTLPGMQRLTMMYAPLGNAEQLKIELSAFIADHAFLPDEAEIRTEAEFRRRLDPGWCRLSDVAHRAARELEAILKEYHPLAVELFSDKAGGAGGAKHPVAWAESLFDIREHLRQLVYPGFLSATPAKWLAHYPRFLAAVRMRLSKLASGGPARDLKHAAEVAPLRRAYEVKAAQNREDDIIDPNLEQFRWMIEELRVSLYAQELRTSVAVSGKRLREFWGKAMGFEIPEG